MSDFPLSTRERNELEILVSVSNWLSDSPRSVRSARNLVPRSFRFIGGAIISSPRAAVQYFHRISNLVAIGRRARRRSVEARLGPDDRRGGGPPPPAGARPRGGGGA